MTGLASGDPAVHATPGQAIWADHDLIIRAEQALLGAVMSDPGNQDWLLGLVHPGDLARPYHGQVLTAMQRLRAKDVVPDPVTVRAELAVDPALSNGIALDGVPIIGLLQATPRPGHAPAYAAIVIDHSIRTRLQAAASRLSQAAELGDLLDAKLMVMHARREVQACAQRRDALPDSIRRCLSMPSVRGVDADALSAGQGVMPSATARLDAEGAGQRMLRDLTAGAHHLPGIRPWLRPAHFASVVQARTYALICGMHAAGQPIDPVTVAWAGARNGIRISPAGLDEGTAAFARDSAREVRRLGILTRAGRAAEEISALVADPRSDLAALLRDTGQRLHSLEDELDPRHPRQSSPERPADARWAARPERSRGSAPTAEPG